MEVAPGQLGSLLVPAFHFHFTLNCLNFSNLYYKLNEVPFTLQCIVWVLNVTNQERKEIILESNIFATFFLQSPAGLGPGMFAWSKSHRTYRGEMHSNVHALFQMKVTSSGGSTSHLRICESPRYLYLGTCKVCYFSK